MTLLCDWKIKIDNKQTSIKICARVYVNCRQIKTIITCIHIAIIHNMNMHIFVNNQINLNDK